MNRAARASWLLGLLGVLAVPDLPVTIHRPPGDTPVAFVVLLHGCGGLKHESMWSRWIKPWAELFGQHGLATPVVDSFSPRGVDQVCADTMTPARHCEQMKAAQPASAPELKLIVSPGGPHTFDMRLPDRTVLGMRPGFDAEATAGGRRQVLEFLTPTA